MLEKIIKKAGLCVLAASIGLASYGCAVAPGSSDSSPKPTPTPYQYTAETNSIVKAADRLVQLQNVNGSWDWIVTGQTGPTGITYLNISGVTGEGLLDAYKVTGDSKYLDAAKKTGDYIINQMGNPVDITKRPNAFNVMFLHHLNEAGGDAKYKTEANAIMSNILYENNYWTYNFGNHATNDGVPGCTAYELGRADAQFRTGNPEFHYNGIMVWDLYKYIEAARKLGDTNWASDLAVLGKQYVDAPGYNSTVPTYILGLSGGIMGMKEAGVDYTNAMNKLLAEQETDGSFIDENGVAQNTAYASMALTKVGKMNESKKAVKVALDHQEANGGWKDIDNEEYSEADSEIVQAITKYIGK